MAAGNDSRTTLERKSDREMVVTRSFDAPAHLVFQAWSNPELFQQWWIPKSAGLAVLSCDMDIRTGGSYRLVMRHPSMEQPMAFFGTYREVTPPSRMVWTNEESPDGAVTTVTFAEKDGTTLVVLTDLYPSKEALDAAIASGSTSGFDEQFAQLDVLLAGR
ncbi:MAG: ATPase [Alphaproteobacteria bacterium]|jgi:uncharacterized protein YndB with AHSA1/START domain|nr:ATPase [Alphaproteobacteria bacterium]MDB5739542.1 ATPase [Alphaproteobacteria bacterium]